jgi:hypothetical protein
MMKFFLSFLLTGLCCVPLGSVWAQTDLQFWHNKPRSIHYKPNGANFECTNGTMRFNRALYGTNTAFRVEAGDLPEFALYMPGMGGNLSFALTDGNTTKWLIKSNRIHAIYRPGSMQYEIEDAILGKNRLYITVMALADAEGMVMSVYAKEPLPRPVKLMVFFGGASGKKFGRDGDIGADPESSFYFQSANCRDNRFLIEGNRFSLAYGSGKVLSDDERYEIKHLESRPPAAGGNSSTKSLKGLFPADMKIKLIQADQVANPERLFNSKADSLPALAGEWPVQQSPTYGMIYNPESFRNAESIGADQAFVKAEASRKVLAERVVVHTPDSFLNTIGGALSAAADGIWESPTYLHGAISWRMRLPAWRGAYVADPLGWHDRAREHFSSYALSQVTSAPTMGVIADTALGMARQLEKIGTFLFSDGYICRNPNGDIRAHHYDMNLVFIDQLINHFFYTGDLSYVKKMWPLIKRHLAWEKRNFDMDGDGLYDAYAAIWASDALQYSGGGVTHSTAYNYRSNQLAALLAKLIGEDANPYQLEADRIYKAMQKWLWMPDLGRYAEYKDLMGNQLLHPATAVWSAYHAIDSRALDHFQSYQMMEYVHKEIPHIPVRAYGLPDQQMSLVATTNWQPYVWSLNNVVLAECLHTALAFWQSGRVEEGFHLWRSTMIESMYLSASPGGFQLNSFYDAARGELYRDFADGVGMAGRTLTEGLFGIVPDLLRDTLTVSPGYPLHWPFANLKTPDVQFAMSRNEMSETYKISHGYGKKLVLNLRLPVSRPVEKLIVNGVSMPIQYDPNAIGQPILRIVSAAQTEYEVQIQFKAGNWEDFSARAFQSEGAASLNLQTNKALIRQVFDPQRIVSVKQKDQRRLQLTVQGEPGARVFFLRLEQHGVQWWEPVSVAIEKMKVEKPVASIGSKATYEKVVLDPMFNLKVTEVFQQKYLSPRPISPTLMLPVQGIGQWCYPMITAKILDAGLRQKARNDGTVITPDGVPFLTPADTTKKNILFTSQWDNFPKSVTIPVQGKASQLHFLLAGTTNPMQSRIVNGRLILTYESGRNDTLHLRNPENWWPIEQDYMIDNYAFTTDAPVPLRLYLKTGEFGRKPEKYVSIKGHTSYGIDGGGAVVLSMAADRTRNIKSVVLETVANDVVIGLMGLTIQRD